MANQARWEVCDWSNTSHARWFLVGPDGARGRSSAPNPAFHGIPEERVGSRRLFVAAQRAMLSTVQASLEPLDHPHVVRVDTIQGGSGKYLGRTASVKSAFVVRV